MATIQDQQRRINRIYLLSQNGHQYQRRSKKHPMIILVNRNGSKGQKWQMSNDLSIESKLCPTMVLDIKDGDAKQWMGNHHLGQNGESNQ